MEWIFFGLALVNFLGMAYLAKQMSKDRKHDCVDVVMDQMVDEILDENGTDEVLLEAVNRARAAVADYEAITTPKKKRGRPRKNA